MRLNYQPFPNAAPIATEHAQQNECSAFFSLLAGGKSISNCKDANSPIGGHYEPCPKSVSKRSTSMYKFGEQTMMETKHKILIVDDDANIASALASVLVLDGYIVRTADDGEEALLRVADFAPDLILLDLQMPKLNGRQVCRKLRAKDNWTPIIMLTVVGDMAAKLGAFEEGADDYIVKPFQTPELRARIKAALRRDQLRRERHPNVPPLAAAPRLKCGNLVFDQDSGRVLLSGKELSMPGKLKDLLRYMMIHHGEELSKDRLLETLWGWVNPTEARTRTVDKHICDLRKYLKEDPEVCGCIQTIRCKGYAFNCQVEVES